MSTSWEKFAGREDRFAIRVALRSDPDPGFADPDVEGSWGSFQLWIDGKNLCAHADQGETMDSVHWHLLPMLEWFAQNWDPLFHEERLPLRVSGASAAESLQQTLVPSLASTEEQAQDWDVEWFDWWRRHALRAARAGGALPDVVVRRWRDRIEFSWGDSPLAGEAGLLFLSTGGSHRLDTVDVGPPLLDVLTDVTAELATRYRTPRLASLQQLVNALEAEDRRATRVGWMAGLRSLGASTRESWERVEDAFADASAEARNAALGVAETAGIVRGSCQAALLFGAVAPDVTERDVRRLATLLIDQYEPGSEGDDLRALVSARPFMASGPAWQDGYALAEEAREALGLDLEESVDLDELFMRLGIDVRHIDLDDANIRGVSMASPEHKPTVAINDRSVFGRSHESQRFTLAHELCHLLFDRWQGQRLAVASGPWAPLEVEQRANAFGAAFLMPPEGIRAFVDTLDEPVDEDGSIDRTAQHFRVSRVATIEHLRATGFISDEARARLRGWVAG